MYWVFVLFASCANIVPPDGGPKDITPPIVINSTPENPSIYFKNNVITLLFNAENCHTTITNLYSKSIDPQVCSHSYPHKQLVFGLGPLC